MEKITFLRFEIHEVDEYSHSPRGVFSIAYEITKDGSLPDYQIENIKSILKWFENHIPIPKKFGRGKKKNASHTKGISWIKSSATDATSKLFELKTLLEQQGFVVEVIKTDNPGYVIYEDAFQIVAEPFSKLMR